MSMTQVAELIHICPSCFSERALSEFYCENVIGGAPCLYPLADEDALPIGSLTRKDASQVGPAPRVCTNGHALEAGDELCTICGEDVAGPSEADGRYEPGQAISPEPDLPVIDGWSSLRLIPPTRIGQPWRTYDASRDGRAATLTLYDIGHEPDPAVHDALRRMPLDHVPDVMATGRYGLHAFEVTERLEGGSLADGGDIGADRAGFDRIVDEISRALQAFTDAGLRHRDLRPTNILIRTHDPLDLVITGFGSARLADFDLEAVASLELSRFSAPETIVGAVSAASDWWSLGMILLDLTTRGRHATGIADKAFHLHVVARGVDVPRDLDPAIRMLLRGLLARDPLVRWAAPQVAAWLRGESPTTPPEFEEKAETGPPIVLAGVAHRDPPTFALAASAAAVWDEAKDLTLRGAIATWVADQGVDPQTLADVRRFATDTCLTDDHRHALTMMALNTSLPLALKGDIVTPAWLLAHPLDAQALLNDVTPHLERLGRETWLVRLRTRADTVREKAHLLGIELDEERGRLAMLASSRANLEAERDSLRRVYPDSDHAGVGSLMGKVRPSEEDLVILVSAAAHQFTPLATLVDLTTAAAERAGVLVDATNLPSLLTEPPRTIFAAVEARVTDFARCGNDVVDGWADAFRVERRMVLPKAATLLTIPAERWKPQPRHTYVANLIGLFEKRVSATIARGPLARFMIGKTTPRLDLMELGAGLRSPDTILAHLVSRAEHPLELDPAAWTSDQSRLRRLRRLVAHADTFRRDTGIDGRYLAFPFLVHAPTSLKPRVAPVLLWPVDLTLEGSGGTRAVLKFDHARDEIRLNPALEGLVGSDMFLRLARAREDVLARATLTVADVIDVFGSLLPSAGGAITAVPGREPPRGGSSLVTAGALFNAEFTSQSVAEDLKTLKSIPPTGTSLASAIRVLAPQPQTAAGPFSSPEVERFSTAESDPSQDAAVLSSRIVPGLVVEGPPGTGKSQTIVNIVTDAMGRGETVLVVCQKQAALTVVQKRLDAEGLGNRLFSLIDGVRDREPILRALRDQLQGLQKAPLTTSLATLRRQRAEKAAFVDELERELDRAHAALHGGADDGAGSYREILGQLVGVEDAGSTIDAPRLRRTLADLPLDGIVRLEETCAPVSRLWLESAFEDSALAILRPFPVDDATVEDVARDFDALVAADTSRNAAALVGPFEIDDPASITSWLMQHVEPLATLDDDARLWLAALLDMFRRDGDDSEGVRLTERLRRVIEELNGLDPRDHADTVFAPLSALPAASLAAHLEDATIAVAPTSIFGRLSPGRFLRRRRIAGYLNELGVPLTPITVDTLFRALTLEGHLRPLRTSLAAIETEIGIVDDDSLRTLAALRAAANATFAALVATGTLADAILQCPLPAAAAAMARKASLQAFQDFRNDVGHAIGRYGCRAACREALEPLAVWCETPWIDRCAARLAEGRSLEDLVRPLMDALPTLVDYQRFRSRVMTFGAGPMDVFSILRGYEPQLRAAADQDLEALVRRTLRREWLKTWKAKHETAAPELLLGRAEIDGRISRLETLDEELRQLNKRLLSADTGDLRGTPAQWEDVTRLKGPRKRSLREFFDEGRALGLMRLRPVWLMSPDVASRILPLTGGLFDLAIFDEASQMPVEHAAPTLYRAKRVVIAGDEKQMPPTSFFGSQIDEGADDDGSDVLDDGATEAERDAAEATWNKQDIQACPDLLQLGRGFLPTTTLQIHYRSRYRELIGFSNAAFYKSDLSVPARHPDDEVRRRAPLEVVRVDGVYEGQTNPTEVEAVVSILADYWTKPAEERPSLGVVTFNRKQADLVAEAVDLRAAADVAFRHALDEERARRQDGEDMGFFVKNLENVQGDERDIVIFSTTFGRDRHGVFRRNFGVLGQAGGERRLNVAVTRARAKVVLVTSMPIAEVSDWLGATRAPDKPRDYLQAYLQYASLAGSGHLEQARRMCRRLDSTPKRDARIDRRERDGLETSVAAYITAMGYDVAAAPTSDDAFGLDFAIVDPATGLFGIGIECDAPRHVLLSRARGREIWRRRVLTRAIPVIHRVSSRDWYERGPEEQDRLGAAIRDALRERAAA